MDRIDDLRVFASIVDAGGISAAAERLKLSKSVISRRLRALEERLGVELLTRTTRSQRLTRVGQTFYERCVAIIADMDAAESAVAHSASTLSGTLRITAPIHFGQAYLAPIIADFLDAHTELQIDLDMTDSYSNLIDEGFDLAIRIGSLPDSSLRVRRLMTVPMTVCAAPAYLKEYGRPLTPGDLTRHQGLIHRSGAIVSDWSYERADSSVMRVRTVQRFVTNNDNALLTLARRGHGIVCMPRFIVEQAITSGALEEILTDVGWQNVDVQIVYPHARHLSNRVRNFIDFLVQNIPPDAQT